MSFFNAHRPYKGRAADKRLVWVLALLFAAILAFIPAFAAVPVAGTIIRMDATATYFSPDSIAAQTVRSNEVMAVVKGVQTLNLVQDHAYQRPAGSTIQFAHLLSNSGNLASSYRFSLDTNGCAAGNQGFQSLSLYADNNGNGIVDAGDTKLTLDSAGALTLPPGDAASLVLQGIVPVNANGSVSCIRLLVSTDTVNQVVLQAANRDSVTISSNAALLLNKSVSYTGLAQPGYTVLTYSIQANNIGTSTAAASSSVPDGGTVVVDGHPTAMLLLRDVLPLGTQYVAGSLRAPIAGAVRLFRLANDAAFSYHSAPAPVNGNIQGYDDASAVEVAVGLPAGLQSNAAVAVDFQARLLATAAPFVYNTALANFHDGAAAIETPSNVVVVRSTSEILGIAKAASVPIANVDVNGQADGTATVRFHVVARNYGLGTLYNVGLVDALENIVGGLGQYTAASQPAAGQYTVVANSITQVAQSGVGTQVSLNTGYTGQATHAELLSNGSRLPPGGSVTLQFDVRFNQSGLPDTLYNSASGHASNDPYGATTVSANSVNGLDPDINHDGNPNAHAGRTPYANHAPVLSLLKTVAPARPVSGSPGVYDLDVTVQVKNETLQAIANVRLADALSCAFEMDRPDGHFASWSLRVAPTALKGFLVPNAGFTGATPCDRTMQSNPDAYASFPFAQALNLVDGQHSLPAGETEFIKFTLRATLKPAAIGTSPQFTNRAWAGVLLDPSVTILSTDDNRRGLAWASSSTALALLGDPSGIVYNAATRQPVVGARVTMTRSACQTTAISQITAAQLFGDSSIYTFHADGSVSVATDVAGQYSFVFKSPPVNDLCNYSLVVTPPAASGLKFPSVLAAPHAGVFVSCGAVAAAGIPALGAAANYYTQLTAGKNPTSGALCEVSNNNIPLDPANSNGLTLEKTANVTTVEVGDLMRYTLKASNYTQAPVTQLMVKDQLPVGFHYVPGSARFNGVRMDDPQGGIGPNLRFTLPLSDTAPLDTGNAASLSYLVRVAINAVAGEDAINRAWATAGTGAGAINSNEADARVRVQGGVFATDAYAFGKVFLDCNKNGLQDEAELGIPGVRLFLEDGTDVVTDVEGKWSLYGLRPVTHALRLDESTLPPGAQVALMEPRQSKQADSLFLDLKNGEWHKANFAVQNCISPGLLEAVQARRDAIIQQPASEGDAARVSTRLSTDVRPQPGADVRGLPAAGAIDSSGNLKAVSVVSSPLITLTTAAGTNDFTVTQGSTVPISAPVQTAPSAASRSAPHVPEPVPLEDTLSEQDRSLGFLDWHDTLVLPSATANVRIKGSLGSRFRLSVNGQPVDEDRVGKRAVVEGKHLEAWEFIAVPFQPGNNLLGLQELDSFGNARGNVEIHVMAPGPLAQIAIDVATTAKADLRARVPVTIRLLDALGTPVTERTALTLESVAARWDATDLNPAEAGVQVMLQGGSATFDLVPPATPGDGKIRISNGTLQNEARIIFLPDLRPLTGIGVLEGVIHIRDPGKLPMGAARAADAFESELRGWAGASGDVSSGGRSAFYFKGAVKGEYLLTAAYDSDKTTATTMFRDIQPDQFYPIYGDSASKGFDAQSSQRLYVRVDKNRSFLLFGDYNTAASSEVRKLSQVSRTATGLQHVYNSEDLRVTSHYSRDSLQQRIEEFAGNGTSGPYSLNQSGASDLFANSETVQIVVRDRNQPNVILSTTTLTRFVDYSIQPLGKTILFTRPIFQFDTDLNPQSIRVNYVVDTGGPVFDVGGVDVQLRVSDRLQLGAVAEYDGTPDASRKLAAATALAMLDSSTVLRGEVVGTQSDLKGDGQAVGLELRHDDKLLKYNLNVQISDNGFDNPSASISAGHSEARSHLDYQLSADTHLKADLVYTQDNNSAAGASNNAVQTQGASVALQTRLNPIVTTEVGLRAGRFDTSSATNFDYRSVSSGAASPVAASTSAVQDTLAARGRVTVNIPDVPKAQVFAEAEQDVNDVNRHIAAIGGNYSLNDKTRMYGRYEFISSMGNEYALANGVQRNVGLIGLESNYMEGGRVYDEYRIADTIDGRAMQSATGVRNTVEVREGLRVTGGLEQVSALPSAIGTSTGESKAITGAIDWLGTGVYANRLRGSSTLEFRDAADATSSLFSMGVAYKLNPDWSVLSRATLNRVGNRVDGSLHWLEREQIGFAYRPVDQDVWNTLLRYEHKADRWDNVLSTTALPINSLTDILSAHVNYQPRLGDILSARLAAKQNTSSSDGINSNYGAQLLYGRWTHDISESWDFGFQLGLLFGDGGTQQHTAGAELGYQLTKGLWVSGGYNVIGLHDPDLAGADYTDAGFYVRLRFKFDERLFNNTPGAKDLH